MTVFTHHGVRYSATPVRPVAALFAFFTRVARRLADSPFDQAVLHATSTHIPAPLRATAATARPHARWQAVVGEDGHRRLEARWHSGD
ncbi:hypothetical protein ACIBCO_30935 [Streptomyces violascens]|uniref:hypothetical protein n=1 Tax=Streptomyces violascens TaxID=67381 RepID=UPI00379FE154